MPRVKLTTAAIERLKPNPSPTGMSLILPSQCV